MNIISCYLSPHYRTGGQRRYLELLSGLAERGHRIVLFKRDDVTLPKSEITMINLRVVTRGSRDRSFARALKWYLKNEVLPFQPTGIFQFGESAMRSLILLKTFFKIPIYLAVRSNWVVANRLTRREEGGSPFKKAKDLLFAIRDSLLERKVSKNVDHIVFQSKWDRDAFFSRQKYQESNCTIIPNSIQASWFVKEFRSVNQSKSLKKILFIGSDGPRKGLYPLLEAFSRVRSLHPQLELELLGHFDDELADRLKDKAWDQGVTIGSVVDSSLPALKDADLFIIPSLYDSFPNILLEALFVGTPSCGSKVAGIDVMLDKEEILFTPGSVSEIEKMILRWLDEDFYQEHALWCRRRVEDFDFDWIEALDKRLTAIQIN